MPYLKDSGYKVVFSYDGINWQETTGYRKDESSVNSQAREVARDTFNNRFKTISKGQSNDGTPLTYDYNDNKSTLKVNMDGTNPASNDKNFRMTATTGTYKTSQDNIDCGLVKKEFDLALGTDVARARVEINGKTKDYTYAQIKDGVLDFQDSSSTAQDVNYNLYLYYSDYNYRIADYKTDNTAIANQVNENDNTNITAGNELEVYVTYSIALKEQTTISNATVDEFVYYYDKAYSPTININDVVNGYKLTKKEDGKLTFTNTNTQLNPDDYRVNLELTFKVNKDNVGNIITKEFKNVVEITKYSTEKGGLIDRDSAPDNANVSFNNNTPVMGQYEDDTDEAKGLKVQAPQDKTRTISGKVFDDTNKDGILGEGDKAVNDVIVQLIEIKTINNTNYEYIWQETRSGSNKVKITGRNGYAGIEYNNNVTESGAYEFKDYIPGNYIIRYIYGDGRTYDVTDSVKTYNGQDYKSTIDKHYQDEVYSANYDENASVARDNEARRLEVMKYSAVIDKDKGEKLANKEKEALKNTWMAAETSKLNVPVDNSETSTQQSTVSYGNMNFGLAKRPETKLTLEKHITGLKITPAGTGVQSVVDAKADIKDIVEKGLVTPTGVTTGLATIKSTRSDRGFWQVATDVEELMQGANLEVEYTYVVKNDSEDDYLSTFLVNAYKDGITNGEYTKTLNDKAGEVKVNTKGKTNTYGSYLGQWYYTGKVDNEKDAEVISRVEVAGIEEALNNSLAFDANDAKDFIKSNTAAQEKTVYDVEGNVVKENIETTVTSKDATKFLAKDGIDYSKTITLYKTLSSTNGGELGADIPSYIAQVVKYSNAAGRRDVEAIPGNLTYVHSYDNKKTLDSDNEHDEFWGERIIITKPTGEDKAFPMQAIIIAVTSVATLGVGIVLIKKFVLKK